MTRVIIFAALLAVSTAEPYEFFGGAKNAVLSLFGSSYVPANFKTSRRVSPVLQSVTTVGTNANTLKEVPTAYKAPQDLQTERSDEFKTVLRTSPEERTIFSASNPDVINTSFDSTASIATEESQKINDELEVIDYPVYYNISAYLRRCHRKDVVENAFAGQSVLEESNHQPLSVNLILEETTESRVVDTVQKLEERLPETNDQNSEINTTVLQNEELESATLIETASPSSFEFENFVKATTETVVPEIASNDNIQWNGNVELTEITTETTQELESVFVENDKLQDNGIESVEITTLSTSFLSESQTEISPPIEVTNGGQSVNQNNEAISINTPLNTEASLDTQTLAPSTVSILLFDDSLSETSAPVEVTTEIPFINQSFKENKKYATDNTIHNTETSFEIETVTSPSVPITLFDQSLIETSYPAEVTTEIPFVGQRFKENTEIPTVQTPITSSEESVEIQTEAPPSVPISLLDESLIETSTPVEVTTEISFVGESFKERDEKGTINTSPKVDASLEIQTIPPTSVPISFFNENIPETAAPVEVTTETILVGERLKENNNYSPINSPTNTEVLLETQTEASSLLPTTLFVESLPEKSAPVEVTTEIPFVGESFKEHNEEAAINTPTSTKVSLEIQTEASTSPIKLLGESLIETSVPTEEIRGIQSTNKNYESIVIASPPSTEVSIEIQTVAPSSVPIRVLGESPIETSAPIEVKTDISFAVHPPKQNNESIEIKTQTDTEASPEIQTAASTSSSPPEINKEIFSTSTTKATTESVKEIEASASTLITSPSIVRSTTQKTIKPFKFFSDRFQLPTKVVPTTRRPTQRIISFTSLGRNKTASSMRHFLDYLSSLRK